MCVCVCERKGENGGGEKEFVHVCVNFVSFAGISTSVKNMSLKRRVLSQIQILLAVHITTYADI